MTRQPLRRPAPSRSPLVGTAVRLALLAVAALLIAPLGAAKKKVTHVTGSRATYVHRLPLLDAEKGAVATDDDPCMPFVYSNTCTKCHEYDEVRKGWHFNAADPDVDPGRPGRATPRRALSCRSRTASGRTRGNPTSWACRRGSSV